MRVRHLMCSLFVLISTLSIASCNNHEQPTINNEPIQQNTTIVVKNETCHHTYDGMTVIQEPTCTTNGVAVLTCTTCGYQEQSTISAYGQHIEQIIPAVAATCQTSGLTEGRSCLICNTVIVKQQVIPQSQCTPGNWIVEKEATCASNGSRYKVCTSCGKVLTSETTSKSGHVFNSWTENSSVGCLNGGSQTRTCNICGYTETNTTSAAGHNWSSWQETVSANCTSTGVKIRYCINCSETETQIISQTSHNYIAATCTTPETCKTCGTIRGGAIEHNFVNGFCTLCGINDAQANPYDVLIQCIYTLGRQSTSKPHEYVWFYAMSSSVTAQIVYDTNNQTIEFYSAVREDNVNISTFIDFTYGTLYQTTGCLFYADDVSIHYATEGKFKTDSISNSHVSLYDYISDVPYNYATSFRENTEQATILTLTLVNNMLMSNQTGITIHDLGFINFTYD